MCNLGDQIMEDIRATTSVVTQTVYIHLNSRRKLTKQEERVAGDISIYVWQNKWHMYFTTSIMESYL
jgi:hypothetical protein